MRKVAYAAGHYALARENGGLNHLAGRTLCAEQALHAKIGPDGKIEQALLPLGITSARDWLDAAIRYGMCVQSVGHHIAHAHECGTFGDRVIRQECRPVAASPYRYNGHGHLAPASRAELLAMQAMAKMGTADDVLKLLKSFKLLQTASADLIKVHSIHTR